jgi:hypothetical protein
MENDRYPQFKFYKDLYTLDEKTEEIPAIEMHDIIQNRLSKQHVEQHKAVKYNEHETMIRGLRDGRIRQDTSVVAWLPIGVCFACIAIVCVVCWFTNGVDMIVYVIAMVVQQMVK